MARGGNHGGGRPKGSVEGVSSQSLAQKVLAKHDQFALWGELLSSKDERIRLQALINLSDRAYGKPRETHEVGGIGGGPVVAWYEQLIELRRRYPSGKLDEPSTRRRAAYQLPAIT